MTNEQPDVHFDLLDPLPTGTLAIQASAGTGKTYALAGLATRFIAEGRAAASELLIVTFTRAATNELRAKVRERLSAAAEVLSAGTSDRTGDPLLDALVDGRSDDHLERIRRALTEFDAATVTTIHGFAKQVLGALGVTAGTDPDTRLDPDSYELIAETCADVLAGAAVGGTPAAHLPRLRELVEATRNVDGRPDLVLVPDRDQPGATPEQLVLCSLVERSVAAVAERRRRTGTLSFDDILIELRDALDRPGAAAAIESLRNRFSVVLIDEFQDTDRVQWDIFSRLFDHPGSDATLVLVGDPKQAIYGFRGADIHTYLDAVVADERTERRSLATNWRSDAAVLRSLDVLFTGSTFGDPRISFSSVDVAPPNQHRHLVGAGGTDLPALSVRLATGSGIPRYSNRRHLVLTGAAERTIHADLVARVRDLLDSGRITDGATGTDRQVRPPDIAVLVGRHTEGTAIHAALVEQGVPAVLARGGSVLTSPAAEQMRWFLYALGRPSDPRRVRMYALSWFAGRSAGDVATMPDTELVALQEQLRRWAERLATHTVADVLAQVWSESGVAGHVLRTADGDRNMTDLNHLAELLQTATTTGRSGVAGLLSVLDNEPEKEGDSEVDGDVAARRIASEADSVQIMTLWTAKGLEFPIVCLPTLWHPPSRNEPVVFLDPSTGRRTYDLAKGKDWPDEKGSAERTAMAFAEATGERLRLLYVAMTRAKHQTILWWAQTDRSATTALARILFARDGAAIDQTQFLSEKVRIPDDGKVVAALDPLVAASGGTLAVEAIDQPDSPTDRWTDTTVARVEKQLMVAPFLVRPDRTRQRWSFSAITDHAAVSAFDPSDQSLSDSGAGDERGDLGFGSRSASVTDPDETPPEDADSSVRDRSGHLADLPAGTAFGTLIHSLLEEIEFTADDLEVQLDAAIGRQLAWRSFDLTPSRPAGASAEVGRRALVEGIRDALHTPLGAQFGGLRLADVPSHDRLAEVSFDLRLAEGHRTANVRDIGSAALHHLEPSHLLHPWAAGLAEGAIDVDLAGHLTGSIDLVLRTDSGDGRQRFVVADYKTNALHPRGVAVGADDYGPLKLAEAMAEHDYPLQALLYSVALHRLLRWRLAERYRPELHLGGIAYLFLRGMTGPDAVSADGSVAGVYAWDLPSDLVIELSELLDGQPSGVPT